MTKLGDLRKAEHLTQEELATLLGVSKSTICSYEYGQRRPSPKIATQIGTLFSLTTDQLWDMFYAKPD